MGVKVKKHKGSWYVFIHFHGQRKAKKVGSREAAEKVKREIEAKLALGDVGILHPDVPKLPIFREYSESWIRHHAVRHMKPSTADFYDQFLRLYVLPTFGDTPLDEIRRGVVKEWIVGLAGREFARNTIRLAVSSLRVVLNAAIEDGLIEYNPAQKLGKLVRVDKPEREATALTSREVAQFLKVAKETCRKHYPFFLTALRSGLREGELVALQWGDLQFGASEDDRNRYILVQRNYDRRSGRFLTPKSRKARRVDMSLELRHVLSELRDQRLLEAFSRGQETIANEFVFPSQAGTVLDITNLVPRHFLPLLERAGLRRIRFHDLRQNADCRIMPNSFQIHRLEGLGPRSHSA